MKVKFEGFAQAKSKSGSNIQFIYVSYPLENGKGIGRKTDIYFDYRSISIPTDKVGREVDVSFIPGFNGKAIIDSII